MTKFSLRGLALWARCSCALAVVFAGGLAGLSGCAADEPQAIGPSSVIIDNQSQYVLDEVRHHVDRDYSAAPNITQDGLLEGGTVLFHASGERFVTVFRVRNRGGPTIALTTDIPLSLGGLTGHRLMVFDDSFRLEDEMYVPEVSDMDAGTSTSS